MILGLTARNLGLSRSGLVLMSVGCYLETQKPKKYIPIVIKLKCQKELFAL